MFLFLRFETGTFSSVRDESLRRISAVENLHFLSLSLMHEKQHPTVADGVWKTVASRQERIAARLVVILTQVLLVIDRNCLSERQLKIHVPDLKR